MNRAARRLLYWTPRLLCIVFAAFISIFALDVFQKGVPVWQVALALLMHLLPTFLVLSVLALSWRREWVGGALFIALGLLYLLWARNKPFFGWDVVLLIAAPLFLVGVLFLLNWRHRAQLRPGP
jgi:hypothetical protein